jgi:hypothetical protein
MMKPGSPVEQVAAADSAEPSGPVVARARRRLLSVVGGTPARRAEWLLRLPEVEWDRLDEKKRARWMSEVEFSIREPGHELQGYPWMQTQEQIGECHAWLKSGLDDLREEKTWEISYEFVPNYIVQLKTPQVSQRTPLVTPLISFRESVFRDSIHILLERLRFCPRPGCRRAFLKRKRKRYCARACSQAQRSADFRKEHAAELTRKRRARYVKRLAEKHGPAKVKIKTGLRQGSE